MNSSEYSSEDFLKPAKLSCLHRRVFPLNLFNPSVTANTQAFITLPVLNSSPTTPQKQLKINKKYLNQVQPCEKQTKLPAFPSLDYKTIKKLKNEKNLSNKNRNFRKFEVVSYGKSKSLDKKHIFRSLEKNKRKKKNLSEILEELKPVKKVRRISSSQIHHPALNMGQILDRIKELVLDPLKDEINN